MGGVPILALCLYGFAGVTGSPPFSRCGRPPPQGASPPGRYPLLYTNRKHVSPKLAQSGQRQIAHNSS